MIIILLALISSPFWVGLAAGLIGSRDLALIALLLLVAVIIALLVYALHHPQQYSHQGEIDRD